MKNLNNYIFEKLKIDDKTKVFSDAPDYLPKEGEKVLLISTDKKTSRESYLKYEIAKVDHYEDNAKILVLKNSFDEDIKSKFLIKPEEKIKNFSNEKVIQRYFADYRNDIYSFRRVFNIEHGSELLKYGMGSLRNGLRYVYSGYLLNYNGNKEGYLRKLYKELNETN